MISFCYFWESKLKAYQVLAYRFFNKNVVHTNLIDGISMIGFPIVIADSDLDIPGIKPGLLG